MEGAINMCNWKDAASTYDTSWCELRPKKPVILFLGAGCSFSSGVPRASELAKSVLEKLKPSASPSIRDDLSTLERNSSSINIMDLADITRNNPSTHLTFKDTVARYLYSPSQIISIEYKLLSFLIKKNIISEVFTTNQDVCLERALESQGIGYNRFVYSKTTSNTPLNLDLLHAGGHVNIYKLCGDVYKPYEMCFSSEELFYASKSNYFDHLLYLIKKGCSIIFLGYSVYRDSIGEKLLEAVKHRTQNTQITKIICVDIAINENHKKLCCLDGVDHYVEISVEKYLKACIYNMRPKLNIQHAIFNKESFGGVQTYVYSLMELYRREANNAYIPVINSIYATQDFYPLDSAEDFRKLNGFEYLMASSKAQTTNVIANDTVDVVHAHNFVSAYMAQTLGTPCLLTSHSLETTEREMNHEKEEFFSDDVKRYQNQYYNEIPIILTLSDAHIKELPIGVQHYAKRITAPFLRPELLGVNVKGITSEQGRERLAQSGRLPCSIIKNNDSTLAVDTPTISFFGRPAERKGLGVFEEIIKILFEKGIKCQFLYVGPKVVAENGTMTIQKDKSASGSSAQENSDRTTAMHSTAQEHIYQVSEEIRIDSKSDINCMLYSYCKHQALMYDYYLASDIIIVPSTYEPFGYVALEAISCGRPVIASNVPGLNEVLGEGRGILVDIEKLNEREVAIRMSEKIVDILNNSKKYKDMIDSASEWVSSTYCECNMQQLLNDMYNFYLDSIVRGRKLEEPLSKDIDRLLSESLKETLSWNQLLIVSAQKYRELRAQISPEGSEELYDLFWDIAYWLKANKSLYREVAIIPVKELAQLITEVERAIPKQ